MSTKVDLTEARRTFYGTPLGPGMRLGRRDQKLHFSQKDARSGAPGFVIFLR
jgi:hypothetical protein